MADRIPKVRQTACAVAPSLPETLADCARQPAQPPSPFLEGRKSAASVPRNVCTHLCDLYPRSGKLPAHAVPSRPTGVRRSWSPHLGLTLPPRVGRRCTCAMHTKRSRNPSQGQKTACVVARALSDTLPDCAAAGTLPPPFLNGGKWIASTTRATFALHNQRRRRIRIVNPLFSGCATLSAPTTGACNDAGRHALDPEHARHEHRLRRIRCTCMRPRRELPCRITASQPPVTCIVQPTGRLDRPPHRFPRWQRQRHRPRPLPIAKPSHWCRSTLLLFCVLRGRV